MEKTLNVPLYQLVVGTWRAPRPVETPGPGLSPSRRKGHSRHNNALQVGQCLQIVDFVSLSLLAEEEVALGGGVTLKLLPRNQLTAERQGVPNHVDYCQ